MKKIFQLKFSFTLLSHIFKAIFYNYHKDKGHLIQRFLKDPKIIIDVGAHAGQFSKMVSRIYNNKVNIIAIEPGTYARSILRLSIFFNRFKNIFVIPMAVSDQKDFSFLNYEANEALHVSEKEKQFLKEMVDNIEIEMNSSWWRKQDFELIVAPGLFTHNRLSYRGY